MSGSKPTLPSLSFIQQDSIEEVVPKKSIFEIMENDVNIGQLQKKIVFTISLCYFLGATYLFLPALLYQDPIFMCGDEICSQSQYYKFDGEKYIDLENSMNSITKEFELYGENASQKSFGMSISSLGALAGCYYIGKTMEVKGRQFAFRFAWLLVILGGLLQVTAQSTTYIFIATFFIAFGVMGLIVVSTVYVSEMTSKEFRGYSLSIIYMFFALSQIFIYFECQITTDWRQFLTLFFLVPAILLSFLVYQLIESPLYLASNNQIKESIDIINYITNYNKQDLTITEQQVKSQDQKAKQHGISSLFSYQSLRSLTINNGSVKTACSLVYFGISLSLSLIGGDFVTNIIFMGFTDVFCYTAFGYVSSKIKRKLGFLIFFALSIISLFTITQVQIPAECISDKNCAEARYQLGLLILARFSATFCYTLQVVWQNELFPQPVKGTSTGFLNSVAQIGPYCVPYIQQICTIINVNPLIGLCVIPIFLAIPYYFLQETLGQELQQEIEEEIAERYNNTMIELQRIPSTKNSQCSSDDIESRYDSLQAKLLA